MGNTDTATIKQCRFCGWAGPVQSRIEGIEYRICTKRQDGLGISYPGCPRFESGGVLPEVWVDASA